MTSIMDTRVGTGLMIGACVVGAITGSMLFRLKLSWFPALALGIPIGGVSGIFGSALLGALYDSGKQIKEWTESRPDPKTLGHVVSVEQHTTGLPEHIHLL
jgi:hypothetical protein